MRPNVSSICQDMPLENTALAGLGHACGFTGGLTLNVLGVKRGRDLSLGCNLFSRRSKTAIMLAIFGRLRWEMEARAPGGEISVLLQAWSNGDQRALQELAPIVYDELHRLAQRYLKHERPDHSLQATALVNEAYLRLVDYRRMRWENRAHFFAVSAQLMRRILVDHARRHNQKRGAGFEHLALEETATVGGGRSGDLAALDDAMTVLARLDSRKARVVELRFFGGLSVEETAEVLKISPVTVTRDWNTARAWLYRELSPEAQHEC
jgi:RNA polymerase sigma factor (TIGR02999 family)